MAIDTRFAARIDRLPLSRWHLKIGIPIGSAWFFDAFDAFALAFVLPILIAQWKLDSGQVGLLISAGFVGQILGGIVFGWAAEKWGRVPVTIYSLLLYSVMSLVAAGSWSFWSLLVIRIVQGFGLGGEIPVIVAYVNEWSNTRRRGRFALIYQTLYAIGLLGSAVVASWVVPLFGWQWMFVIGAIPAIVAIPLRRLLPESPRWLASRGRIAEADEVLSRVESEISRNGSHPLPPISDELGHVSTGQLGFKDLFRGRYLVRTISTWVVWFFGFGIVFAITNWIPSIFRTVYHVSIPEAMQLGLNISVISVIGAFVGAALIDFVGRKPLFVVVTFGTGLLLLLLAYHTDANLEFVRRVLYATIFLMSLFAIGLATYTAELYPTELRAIGVGAAGGWSRLSSVVCPALVGFLIPVAGIAGVYTMFGVMALIASLTLVLFGIETRNRVLEEISPSLIERDAKETRETLAGEAEGLGFQKRP